MEEAKQFLSMEDSEGQSLYNHLSDVILRILVEKPADARKEFEHISAAVKEEAFAPPAPADLVDGVPMTAERPGDRRQLEFAAAAAELFVVPDEPEEGGASYPDLMDLARLYELAGVSLGAEETFRMFLSIKRLAGECSDRVRFWGKVSTRDGDYYIAEAPTAEMEDVADPAEMEGPEGANKYTYYATKATVAAWTRLPHVTCAQLVAASRIRRYFTGDLGAAVPGYPPFPGNEANLLRAQVGRISAATAVSPSGFFEVDEDSAIRAKGAEELAESAPASGEELRSLDAWVHHELPLTSLGRCTALPEPEEEDSPEVEQPELEEPMASVAEDPEGHWALRVAPAGAAADADAYVVARSLQWPGAFSIAGGGRFASVYVGDGVIYAADAYTPPMPPPLQREWAPEEGGEPAAAALEEQEDLLEDPTPPEEESEDED